METNLVIEGFKFMGLGMATVFTFLVILIIMMNMMSKILNKFFPEPKPSAGTNNNIQNNNTKVIAAITAAIKYHREG
ncbi:MAG: OadG family protein [Sulfurimonas sp.]|uniref:OadG family protein n=1 Tax=Sulfurimonas sp. TaxID=2022749 RepID=UPI0026292D92|nr:OadG family protein [Sulfurimonas sp.]MCW8894359.1 OadG family protein [Sulfurimonas sp.]MCW8954263.1 OadG family protein [Sulfurimonas sp.]